MEWTGFGIYVGVMGSLVGLLAGVAGTYADLARCMTDEQRSAMKKVAACVWLAIVGMVASLLIVPRPYNYAAQLFFLALIPWIGSRANKILADAQQPKPKS
jgi:hypothetical protein